MGKYKKGKPKREKKPVPQRTKEQRRHEVRVILAKLSDLNLNSTYTPIQELYGCFREYIEQGTRVIINIPFPEIKRHIKGILAISTREEVWVNLKVA